MKLSLNCKETGYPDCTHVMYGETVEEVLRNAKEHRMKIHSYTEQSWNKEVAKNGGYISAS